MNTEATLLERIVLKGEETLLDSILAYAIAAGYSRDTSTLKEAWRSSVAGLSSALCQYLASPDPPHGLGTNPSMSASAAYGIEQARRHRARGVPLEDFLGLFKYYRHAYLDLVDASDLTEPHKAWSRRSMTRFFDGVELGLVNDWTRTGERDQLLDLQASNRFLSNEKNKYLTIFESLAPPVVLFAPGGRVETMNFAAAKLFLGSENAGSFHYGDHPQVQSIPWLEAEQIRFEAGPLPEEIFKKTLSLENDPRTFEMRMTRILDVSGKFSGTAAILLDITERTRTEELLEKNLRLIEELVQNSPSAIAVRDAQGRFMLANQAYMRIFSVGPDLVGKTFAEVYPTPTAELFSAEDAAVLASGDLLSSEKVYDLPGGRKYILVNKFPILDNGVPLGICTIDTDITDLRTLERERRLLFENSIDLLCVAGVDGRFKQLNPAWERSLGWSIDELKSRPWLDFVHPEDRERTVAEAESLISGTNALGFENRFRCKDGSYRTLSWNSSLVPESGYILAVVRDVTEHKRIEEQLRQAQKMQAVGQLAGGIAHDFNNLLLPILGYSELLLDELPGASPVRTTLGHIHSAANKAKDLVLQLLAYSRKQLFSMAVVDVNQTVLDFEPILRRTILENVAIRLDLAPALHSVLADAGQLQQVLINLAVNAQDAMISGGTMIIETANVVLDEEYARKHPGTIPGPHVMLSVSDTGAGMTQETLKHIFEPFFTTKEVGQGTGLGLSTVYGIVRQHKGFVWVYSEPGQGTVFKIYLPKAAASPLPAQRTQGTEGIQPCTGRILVVEDNKMVKELTESMLTGIGYSVVALDTPKDALAFAREGTPIDLLLTDVVMPGMNGLELFRVLREQRPGLKVLFMSGYTRHVIKDQGFMEEGMDFIQKPFTMGDLTRRVGEVMQSAAS
jgi:two-component system, cell cycle sensor histidine kinase and response regulator CckA